MPPNANRRPSFQGRRLRIGRRAPAKPTCGVAVTEVLACIPSGAIVTAGAVHSLLAADGKRYPINTVYKTMCRMSDGLGALRRNQGGFAICREST
jgi:hypothetical protein